MKVKNVRKTKKKLHDAIEECIAYKTAQKIRERTVGDYLKYPEDFLGMSSDSLELDDLKGGSSSVFSGYPRHESCTIQSSVSVLVYMVCN